MSSAQLILLLVAVAAVLTAVGYWLLRPEPRLIWGAATHPDQQMPPAVPTGKTIFIETAAGGINRIELFYRECGTAGNPVVVLLHGLAGSSDSTWYTTFAALGADYHVIAPDLRSHGLSFQAGDAVAIEDLARDVLAMLSQLGITHAHMIGHSMGGLVAMAIAHLAPQSINSLTLIDTSAQFADTALWRFGMLLYPVSVKVRNRLSGWLAENRERARAFVRYEVDPQYHQWIYHKRRLNQTDSAIAVWWAVRAYDASPWVGALRLPTLIIMGEQDILIPLRMRRRLTALIPHAAFITIKDAGHYPQLKYAPQVNAILTKFLADPSAQSAPPASPPA